MSVKRVYEGMFLFDSAAASSWDHVEEQMKRLMERAEGELIKMKKWDERRMTYEIEGKKRGVYVLAFFRAPTDRIAGLERDVQLSEEILRVLILCRDHMTDEKAIEIVDKAEAYVPPPHHEGYGGFGRDREYGRDRDFGRDRDREGHAPRGERVPAGAPAPEAAEGDEEVQSR